MKKFLQIALVLVVSLCYVTNVNAATKQDLINYANSKSGISPELAATVKNYLAENDISETNADQIIAKADQIVAIMNAAGVSDPTKLSKAQKDQVRSLATEAAKLAGATYTYDAKTKTVTVKGSNGKVYGIVPLTKTNRLAATGTDYTVYVAVSGLAVVLVATSLYRKLKGNA